MKQLLYIYIYIRTHVIIGTLKLLSSGFLGLTELHVQYELIYFTVQSMGYCEHKIYASINMTPNFLKIKIFINQFTFA